MREVLVADVLDASVFEVPVIEGTEAVEAVEGPVLGVAAATDDACVELATCGVGAAPFADVPTGCD
jgi:hypothetical protein